MRLFLPFAIFLSSVTALAADLPDQITCAREGSPYVLTLVVRDATLAEGTGAILLRQDGQLIYNRLAREYLADGNVMGFLTAGTPPHKSALLFQDSKRAQLLHFDLPGLPKKPFFDCSY